MGDILLTQKGAGFFEKWRKVMACRSSEPGLKHKNAFSPSASAGQRVSLESGPASHNRVARRSSGVCDQKNRDMRQTQTMQNIGDGLFAVSCHSHCHLIKQPLAANKNHICRCEVFHEGKAASVPGKAASALGKAASALGKAASALGKAASVPGKAALVPGKAASVPGKAALVPGKAALVPGKAALVPGKAASVPGKADIPSHGSSCFSKAFAVL